jgi:hypothetical protein
LGRAFWQEEDDNEDGAEQGRRAQRRRRDAVKVRNALHGGAVVVVVAHGSSEAPIVGDNRGELSNVVREQKLEKLLSHHEARFISWRIYAPLAVKLLSGNQYLKILSLLFSRFWNRIHSR